MPSNEDISHLVTRFLSRMFVYFSSEKSCPFFLLDLFLGIKNFYSVARSIYLKFSFSICCWHEIQLTFIEFYQQLCPIHYNSSNLSVNSLDSYLQTHFIHKLWYFYFFLSSSSDFNLFFFSCPSTLRSLQGLQYNFP